MPHGAPGARAPRPLERHPPLHRGGAGSGSGAAAYTSLDAHPHWCPAARAVLLAESTTYLDRDEADPSADSVGYRQGILWLSPHELTEMIGTLRELFALRVGNKPGPGRSPHLVSLILFPTEQPLQEQVAHSTGHRP